VWLFERSTRSPALAAAYEDLGLRHQRQGTADSGIAAFTEALILFARAGVDCEMQRDSEAACERSGFAAGSRQPRSLLWSAAVGV
jgi:hypothetical protein